jgi:hypothetical protein
MIMTLLGRNPNSIDIVVLQHNEQGQDRRGRMILNSESVVDTIIINVYQYY